MNAIKRRKSIVVPFGNTETITNNTSTFLSIMLTGSMLKHHVNFHIIENITAGAILGNEFIFAMIAYTVIS